MTLVQDLGAALRLLPMIAEIARWDTSRRYRITPLGPFFISLAQCVLMTFTAFVLGRVLGQDFAAFLPYVLLSNALWLFINNALLSSVTVYLNHGPQLRAQAMPLLMPPLAMLTTITVQFAHDLALPLLSVVILSGARFTWFLAIPAFALWLLAALSIMLVLATFGTRHTVIVGTVVGTLTQCLLLATPILWPVQQLGPFAWVQQWNPIFAFIEILRAPLLGQVPAAWCWPAALGWTAILITAGVFTYRITAAKVAIWAGGI